MKSKSNKPKKAPVDVMFEKFIKDPNNNPEVYTNADAHGAVIEKLNFDRKVIEDDIDEAKEEFLQDIDNIFDPVKRKELAEKLDMHDEELMDNLRSISARKENQRLVEESGNCHLHPDNIKLVPKTATLELEQFYDESVNQYIRVLDEVEEKASPLSEAEELATTLALTTDIYADAKDGTVNIEKITKLIASNPELLNRGGVEKKLDELLELVKNQQTIGGDLGSISSSVDSVPEPHISDSTISALIGVPYNSGSGEANKELDEGKAIKEFIDDKFQSHYKKISQLLANHSPETQIEDPFKRCGASNICRQLLATEVFRKFAKNNYKKVKTINSSEAGREFKESKDYKSLQTLIDHAMADYKPMPLEAREKAWNKWRKTLNSKQPYKLKMPKDGTWVNIRDEIWIEMGIEKRGVGHP
jgi:hypothetical protein